MNTLKGNFTSSNSKFSAMFTCFHLFFTHFHLFSSIFTYFHPFSPIFTHFHPFSPIFTDFHPFSPIFTHFHLFSPIFSPIFTYFHPFSLIFTYFHPFSPIFTYFLPISTVFTYFHPFSTHFYTHFHEFSCVFSQFHPCSGIFMYLLPISPIFSHFHPCSSIFTYFSPIFRYFHLCSPILTIFTHFHVISCIFTHVHLFSLSFTWDAFHYRFHSCENLSLSFQSPSFAQFGVITFYFTKNVQNEHLYIKAFERKFHIFQVTIWGPHLVSKKEHFYEKAHFLSPNLESNMFKMNTFSECICSLYSSGSKRPFLEVSSLDSSKILWRPQNLFSRNNDSWEKLPSLNCKKNCTWKCATCKFHMSCMNLRHILESAICIIMSLNRWNRNLQKHFLSMMRCISKGTRTQIPSVQNVEGVY